MTALVVCDRNETIEWVSVGFPGHANDQANYSISNLRVFLEQENKKVLADGGFFGMSMVRPLIQPKRVEEIAWNKLVQLERATIEHVNAHIKQWAVLSSVFRGNRMLLSQATIAVCALHNILTRIRAN